MHIGRRDRHIAQLRGSVTPEINWPLRHFVAAKVFGSRHADGINQVCRHLYKLIRGDLHASDRRRSLAQLFTLPAITCVMKLLIGQQCAPLANQVALSAARPAYEPRYLTHPTAVDDGPESAVKKGAFAERF